MKILQEKVDHKGMQQMFRVYEESLGFVNVEKFAKSMKRVSCSLPHPNSTPP